MVYRTLPTYSATLLLTELTPDVPLSVPQTGNFIPTSGPPRLLFPPPRMLFPRFNPAASTRFSFLETFLTTLT